jgi:Flp pilus assembly protein TadG
MRRASNQTQKTDDKQRGTVAVEFALILLLLAILLMGIMEVGSIARDYQVLQNAAREGARFSALPANRLSGAQDPNLVLQTIRNRVVDYLQRENITVPAGNINVDQTYPVQIGALTVQGSRVTITYTRPLIFSGATSLIPSLGSLPLVGNALFRNFY